MCAALVMTGAPAQQTHQPGVFVVEPVSERGSERMNLQDPSID